MRGPIDFIVVAFKGNNFKGEILKELEKASSNGTIEVLDVAVIAKDAYGDVMSIELSQIDPALAKKLGRSDELIDDDDLYEVAELLEENTAAGILIIEHLWAKGLKKAIIGAGGKLISEGRIHPEAAAELNKGGK